LCQKRTLGLVTSVRAGDPSREDSEQVDCHVLVCDADILNTSRYVEEERIEYFSRFRAVLNEDIEFFVLVLAQARTSASNLRGSTHPNDVDHNIDYPFLLVSFCSQGKVSLGSERPSAIIYSCSC